jgi:hypothetical protein
MNMESRGRSTARCARPAGDRRGVGGFYEAIMAMMIVTVGIVLLTCSFTFLAVRDENGTGLRQVCEDVLSSILDNRTITPSELMLDQRELGCADWVAIKGQWAGGMAVFLTLPDGASRMLYQDEGRSDGERAAISIPVNINEHHGAVSAALLTVWVWT